MSTFVIERIILDLVILKKTRQVKGSLPITETKCSNTPLINHTQPFFASLSRHLFVCATAKRPGGSKPPIIANEMSNE